VTELGSESGRMNDVYTLAADFCPPGKCGGICTAGENELICIVTKLGPELRLRWWRGSVWRRPRW
jgi:hypothetical protein